MRRRDTASQKEVGGHEALGTRDDGTSALLYGCDTLYGSAVGNDCGSGIELMITYANGETARPV
jgi:hypothetical protein